MWAISPSSEGLSGPHHADKTNFSEGEKAQRVLAQCARPTYDYGSNANGDETADV